MAARHDDIDVGDADDGDVNDDGQHVHTFP